MDINYMKKTCNLCGYMDAFQFCHRYPPVFSSMDSGNYDGTVDWDFRPVFVELDYWCGEFQHRSIFDN